MKGKQAQSKRQAAIKAILCTHDSVDRLDIICLGVRFHVSPEVITEDVRSAREALKQEVLERERMAALVRERESELALARKILQEGMSPVRRW